MKTGRKQRSVESKRTKAGGREATPHREISAGFVIDRADSHAFNHFAEV